MDGDGIEEILTDGAIQLALGEIGQSSTHRKRVPTGRCALSPCRDRFLTAVLSAPPPALPSGMGFPPFPSGAGGGNIPAELQSAALSQQFAPELMSLPGGVGCRPAKAAATHAQAVEQASLVLETLDGGLDDNDKALLLKIFKEFMAKMSVYSERNTGTPEGVAVARARAFTMMLPG